MADASAARLLASAVALCVCVWGGGGGGGGGRAGEGGVGSRVRWKAKLGAEVQKTFGAGGKEEV